MEVKRRFTMVSCSRCRAAITNRGASSGRRLLLDSASVAHLVLSAFQSSQLLDICLNKHIYIILSLNMSHPLYVMITITKTDVIVTHKSKIPILLYIYIILYYCIYIYNAGRKAKTKGSQHFSPLVCQGAGSGALIWAKKSAKTSGMPRSKSSRFLNSTFSRCAVVDLTCWNWGES